VSAPDERPAAPDGPVSGWTEPSTADALPEREAARAEAEAETAASLVIDPDPGRSPREATCPYLRLVAADGSLGRPRDEVAPGHRCIAVGDPLALSERQQGLVCLTTSHGDCPRYLRAMLVVPVADAVVAPSVRLHPATLVAAILLVVSTIVAGAFVAANGGLELPVASARPSPTASAVAAASASPQATPSANATPSKSSDPGASASSAPSPSPSPEPSPSPRPSRAPSPRPSPSASTTPRPSSDRFDLLEPCPDKPDCYIYTVRAGDNLISIANYFGIPLATVYRLNPWTRTAGLRAGQELILPPPTR
jgi:hypothetical protein